MKNANIVKTARGENSRKKILKTARLLIGKSDSNSVTLDQIADKCRISKSSILWHFGSKEELFIEVIDTVFQNLEESFKKWAKPEILDGVSCDECNQKTRFKKGELLYSLPKELLSK